MTQLPPNIPCFFIQDVKHPIHARISHNISIGLYHSLYWVTSHYSQGNTDNIYVQPELTKLVISQAYLLEIFIEQNLLLTTSRSRGAV